MTNEGKVYSVGFKGNTYSYALMQLQADHFHGVHCLKGIARSLNKHWIDGRRVYIPIAEISSITEYESWDDFLTACKLAEASSVTARKAPAAITKTKKRSKTKRK